VALSDRQASVVVKDLSKVYQPSPRWMRLLVRSPISRAITALDSVSFEVGPGEICAFVGPNGAGKTTLFRILVGLTTATSGNASVMGWDPGTQSLAIRRRIGWMPSGDRALFMRQTCAENLRFHGRVRGLTGRDLRLAVSRALELVGLEDVANNSLFSLSAGMRSRLQLGWAILGDPRVLILDEPTASVDPIAAYQLIEVIIRIVADRQLAALISSHRLDEIEALHSHVVLLDRGSVLFDGDLDELRGRLDRPHLELQFGSETATRKAAEVLEHVDGIQVASAEPTRLTLIAEHREGIGLVLARLDGAVSELVRVGEIEVPLRDLLAEVYRASPEHPGSET
jgi:ABC-2 type transport system ATP-binding protein